MWRGSTKKVYLFIFLRQWLSLVQLFEVRLFEKVESLKSAV